ncbi:MAG TPA: fructose-bisphosphate aldolase class I, partial [Candidatus Marinimicrobia bacterium]|nr:fructose-bisphosphate aldolase class I [Candidatus Neomarinimicrobiota bacterium]
MEDLIQLANTIVADGKGILAADESTPTCTKRFESIGVESTEVSRNVYRDMLFSAKGLESYISGVIMFDETLRQS